MHHSECQGVVCTNLTLASTPRQWVLFVQAKECRGPEQHSTLVIEICAPDCVSVVSGNVV